MRIAQGVWGVVRSPSRATALATCATISVILLLVLQHGQASTLDGFTSETGGRDAAFAFLAIAVLPAFVVRLDLRIPAWLPWLAGVASLAATSLLWLLVRLGLDGQAWALYGGLHVLRGPHEFTDLDWDIRWLACNQCDSWDPHYGTILGVLKPLTLGAIDVPWVAPLGLLLALSMSLSLVWLARISGSRGAVALLLAALSPAWLLLLDRANLDALVILALVTGAILVRQRATLTRWWVFASLIWVNGALKYYPFALAVALLPALRMRRGWTVLVGFISATLVFMAYAWGDFRDSATSNNGHVTLHDFPSYGRLIVVDRLVGLQHGSSSTILVASALVGLLVLAAASWGWLWGSSLRTESLPLSILALGGSSVFLAAVLVGGYGAGYKGAFLVLAIPLLSLPVQRLTRFQLYSSLVSIGVTMLAVFVAYNALLSTMAGLVSGGFALGAALAVTLRSIMRNRRRSPSLIHLPSEVGTHG